MLIYLGSDHAGFEIKEKIKLFLTEIGYEVNDIGAHTLDREDDYPDFVKPLAKAVSENPGALGIFLGGSGQGEAMQANRFKGVRAAVYYGPAGKNQTDASKNELDILTSTRSHNDANVLSIGARFLSQDEVGEAIKTWLNGAFSEEERHKRRISKIDDVK